MLSPSPPPAELGLPEAMVSSPSLGPCRPAKRRRASSDDEASFLLDGQDATRVQAVIEASIQEDMKRRISSSLRETCADLEAQYPDTTAEGGIQRARQRASSELSDFVRSRECTPLLGPQRSPVLSASPQPRWAASPAVGPSQAPPLLGFAALPPSAASPSLGPASPPAAACGASPSLKPSAASNGEVAAEAPPPVPDLSGLYSHDGLLDHEQLMMAIYASQGLDFAQVQGQAQRFLQDLGLRTLDLGVTNIDEQGHTLVNQCFYLSLARSYLGQEATWADTSELALRLKRAIESAVLAERPGWAQEAEDGKEAMAFADFLPLAMKASSADGSEMNVLAELAVCILDSTAGHVEVYLGSKYKDLEDETAKAQNLVLLWYTPGHYQSLTNDDELGSKVMMTYEAFKEALCKHGVVYIETLE
mmetsp:Transcript_103496/g.299455  ORF Transcript_103496/g.299455 Transcript_103496/m.299455 type:complete len:420 (-) Transcript_103496:205-1464(-)